MTTDYLPKQHLPPGAGIAGAGFENAAYNSMMEAQRRNNLTHYLFFALGAPPNFFEITPDNPDYGHLDITDRHCGITKVLRARLVPLKPFPMLDRDASEEALMREHENDKDETLFAYQLRTAAEIADELEGAYGKRGLKVCGSILGAPHDIADAVEAVIMPQYPQRIIDLLKELEEGSEERINDAFRGEKAIHVMAVKLHREMLTSARMGVQWASRHLDEVEAERVMRSKSNGYGTAVVDAAQKFYYAQLGREPISLSMQGTPINANQPVQVNVTLPEGFTQNEGSAPKRDLADHKECPACSELVMKKARICRYCHTDIKQFEEQLAKEAEGEYREKTAQQGLTPQDERKPIDLDGLRNIDPQLAAKLAKEAKEKGNESNDPKPGKPSKN